mmetsp:Transcript_16948/g.46274  ORF Transcript_16948/g.46274 Transcript_16948/m.46274 type:complete len:281 (-) Transcript_16948:569-1411(-)
MLLPFLLTLLPLLLTLLLLQLALVLFVLYSSARLPLHQLQIFLFHLALGQFVAGAVGAIRRQLHLSLERHFTLSPRLPLCFGVLLRGLQLRTQTSKLSLEPPLSLSLLALPLPLALGMVVLELPHPGLGPAHSCCRGLVLVLSLLQGAALVFAFCGMCGAKLLNVGVLPTGFHVWLLLCGPRPHLEQVDLGGALFLLPLQSLDLYLHFLSLPLLLAELRFQVVATSSGGRDLFHLHAELLDHSRPLLVRLLLSLLELVLQPHYLRLLILQLWPELRGNGR